MTDDIVAVGCASRSPTASAARDDLGARSAWTHASRGCAAVNPQLNAVTCRSVRRRRCAAADRADRRGRARRCAARAAARRAGDDQGKRRPGRLRDGQRRRGIQRRHRRRRQPGRRQLEEGRRDHHRPHQHAGVQLPPRHRQRLSRPHVQPVVAHAYAGRLERRRVVVGGRRHHAARARQRHRRARCAIPRIAPGSPASGRRSGACRRTTRRGKAERVDLGAADVGAGTAGAIGRATCGSGFQAMAARDRARSVVGAGAARRAAAAGADPRGASSTDAADLGGAAPSAPVAAALAQAAQALADAGYEIVDEQDAGLHARLRAVVRDVHSGVSPVHAGRLRTRRRRRHPHRDAVHARQRARSRTSMPT